jgi:hypothetical protein
MIDFMKLTVKPLQMTRTKLFELITCLLICLLIMGCVLSISHTCNKGIGSYFLEENALKIITSSLSYVPGHTEKNNSPCLACLYQRNCTAFFGFVLILGFFVMICLYPLLLSLPIPPRPLFTSALNRAPPS